MTTIVITEDEIAWDTQISVGNVRVYASGLPKVIVKGGKTYASAGDSDAGERLPDWERAGADPETAPGGDWELVVVSLYKGKPRARVYGHGSGGDNTGQNLSGHWLPFPLVLGTGGDYALGALKLGQVQRRHVSATIACKVGALIDINSGGEIQSMLILETLQKAARKRKVAT